MIVFYPVPLCTKRKGQEDGAGVNVRGIRAGDTGMHDVLLHDVLF